MSKSETGKLLYALWKGISNPRSATSWVRRGHLAKNQLFVKQTYWFTGGLPRIPLAELLPESKSVEISLPHVFNRAFDTSAAEACHLCAFTKCIMARKVPEVGTLPTWLVFKLGNFVGDVELRQWKH
jgi:hypothetical protein